MPAEPRFLNTDQTAFLKKLATILAVIVLIKFTIQIILSYENYLPPDFRSSFLMGRERYFWHGYHIPFYTHIVSGPPALILGLVLMSSGFRKRWPQWHRLLGRIQVANILLILVPSGIWMAQYAYSGMNARLSLSLLAILAGGFTLMGWRTAVRRKFADHRIWMTRTFALLCSAVVLRIFGGLGTVLLIDADWYNNVIVWASWLLPLGGYELSRLRNNIRSRSRRSSVPPLDESRFVPSSQTVPSCGHPVLSMIGERKECGNNGSAVQGFEVHQELDESHVGLNTSVLH